jgi:hypothetical protein
VGQEEIPDVIECEGLLEPVRRHETAREERPGIVDQHLDARRRAQERGCHPHDLAPLREIAAKHLRGDTWHARP